MNSIDKYAYKSKICDIDPKSKIVVSMVTLLICLVMNSLWVGAAAVVIMGYESIRCSGISIKKYIKLLMIPTVFLLIGIITIIVNKHDITQQLLVGIKIGEYNYGVNVNSLQYGFTLIFKALGAVSSMYFLTLNTPMIDLFEFFRGTHLPNLIISLMELIYRFIFIISEETENMKIAQDSRLGNLTFKSSIRSTAEMISMIFLRSYRRADRIYTALESRGYEDNVQFMKENYKSGKKIYITGISINIFIIAVGIIEKII